MSFTVRTKVRFADVDPAGIVFYPRYFEMLNAAVEDWFASMGLDFNSMHLQHHMGVPTVKLECEFLAPSELGDALDIRIDVEQLGRSSCTIAYTVTGVDAEDSNGASGVAVDGATGAAPSKATARLRAKGVLVCMDLEGQKSMPWPDTLRPQLEVMLAAPVA